MSLETLKKPFATFKGTFTNIAADGFVSFTQKGVTTNYLDIGDVDWERIVIDWDVTALSGTNCIGKLKTLNDPAASTAPTATTMDAKDGAGNAVVTTTRTGAGRELVVVSRQDQDTGGSNIGRYIGFYLDTSSITDLDGSVTIYVGK